MAGRTYDSLHDSRSDHEANIYKNQQRMGLTSTKFPLTDEVIMILLLLRGFYYMICSPLCSAISLSPITSCINTNAGIPVQ